MKLNRIGKFFIQTVRVTMLISMVISQFTAALPSVRAAVPQAKSSAPAAAPANSASSTVAKISAAGSLESQSAYQMSPARPARYSNVDPVSQPGRTSPVGLNPAPLLDPVRSFYLKSSAANDWVHAYGWTGGAALTLIVDDPVGGAAVFSANASMAQAPWNPNGPSDQVAVFDLSGSFDLQEGQTIHVSDGSHTEDSGVFETTALSWFSGVTGYANPEQVAAEQAVVDAYHLENDDIEIRMQVEPDQNAAVDILHGMFNSGNEPDLVGLVGINTGNMYKGKWLDLTSRIAASGLNTNRFAAGTMALYSDPDDGQTGLPLLVFPSVLYYQKAMFDAAELAYPPANYGDGYTLDGSPVLWDQDTIREVAKRLTLDSTGRNATDPNFDEANIVQYGYIPQWLTATGMASKWGPAQIFSGTPGSYTASIPANWSGAWTWFYNGLFGTQPFTPPFSVTDKTEWGGGNGFNSGKIAMALGQSWYMCCIGEAGSGWDLAATPDYTGSGTMNYGIMHADNMRIPKNSPHADQAFDFLLYMSTDAAPTFVPAVRNGALPALTEANDEFLSASAALFPFVTNWDVLFDGLAYIDNPHSETWLPYHATAYTRLDEFRSKISNTPGLNMDHEIEILQADLEQIFNTGTYLPEPKMNAIANMDRVEGFNWPNGADLTITIDDPEGPGGTWYRTSAPAPWGGSEPYFDLNLTNEYDIKAGQTITVSDGLRTKSTTVTGIEITSVNLVTDEVQGLAANGANLDVVICDQNGCYHRRPESNGSWSAYFATAGTNGDEGVYDIVPGTWINVNDVDEDGDSSTWVWAEPNPFVEANLNNNRVQGREWWVGRTIYLNINNGEYTASTVFGQNPENPGDPNDRIALFNLKDSGYTLKPGDQISMTDNDTVRTLVVSSLTIDTPYAPATIISGKAAPGDAVNVWVNVPEGDANRHVVADSEGIWSTDFSVEGPGDDEKRTFSALEYGMNGGASVPYDGGNTNWTWADWQMMRPSFNVRASNDQFEAYEWPIPSTLTLKFYNSGVEAGDPDYTTTVDVTGPTPWGDPRSYVWINLNGIFDIVPGQLVTVTNGTITKQHTVTSLTFTSMVIETGIVSGTGAPNARVDTWMCVPDRCANRHVMTDENGDWSASFRQPGQLSDEQDVVDPRPGDNVDSGQYDEDGDGTLFGKNFPNPHIDVWYKAASINAYGWPLGTDLELSIEDPGTELSPDYVDYKTVGVAPWDSNETVAQFDVDRNVFEILPGMTLTVTGGALTRQLVIVDLNVTGIDIAADVVSGTAPVDVPLWMHFDQNSGDCCRDTRSDAEGKWSIDYSQPGPDGQQVEDIRPGVGGTINAPDEDGDNTSVHWDVPNPTLFIRANEERAEAWDYPLNSTLTLKIFSDGVEDDTPDYTATRTVYGPPDWGDPRNYVNFDLWQDPAFDVTAGMLATIEDDINHVVKKLTVTNLAFTTMDVVNDTVSGVAPANSNVDVWACVDGPCYNRHVVADNDGNWTADWSEQGPQNDEKDIIDLQPNTWVDSSQNDEDGDGTMYGRNLPDPRFDVWYKSGNVDASGWEIDTLVTLEIDDPATPDLVDYSDNKTVYSPSGNPNDTRADFVVDPNSFEIRPGMTISVYGGGHSKSLVVADLTITEINTETDIISGTAGNDQSMWMFLPDQQPCCRNFMADAGGLWSVNYALEDPDGKPAVDIRPGMNGTINARDVDGDNTSLDWRIPNPMAWADLTDGNVSANDFAMKSALTLEIDDPATPASVDYTRSALTQPADWDMNLSTLLFPVHHDGFLITPGMTVTLTDGTAAISSTMANVTANAYEALDMVIGTASPNADMWIYVDDSDVMRHVTADGDGSWSADFANPGDEDNEQSTLDIVEGSRGKAWEGGSIATGISWFAGWNEPTPGYMRVALSYIPSTDISVIDTNTWLVLNQIYETLFKQAADGSLQPAAASGYAVSPDGLTYTITLKSDGRWSDGTTVVAQDYIRGLMDLMSPEKAFGLPTIFLPIAGMQAYYDGTGAAGDVGLAAPNDTTLVITLAQPAPYFNTILAHPGFLPKHPVDSGLTGNGPYVLEEQGGAHMLLGPNQYHRSAGAAGIKRIAFLGMPSEQDRMKAFEDGNVQVIYSALADWGKFYQADPVLAANLYSEINISTQFAGLLPGHAPINDLNVRKALAAATNREALVNAVYGATFATPATSLIPNGVPGHRETGAGIAYDPTAAQAYLSAAGFPGGSGFPTLELISRPGSMPLSEALAQQWETTLGINVEVVYDLSPNQDLNNCRSTPVDCPYEAYRLGWYADYLDGYNFLGDFFLSGPNYAEWSDPTFEALLTSARAEADAETRIGYLQQAEDIVLSGQTILIPMLSPRQVHVLQHDIHPSASGPFMTYFSDWSGTFKEAPLSGSLDQPLNLTLSWEAVDGASEYFYCVDEADNGGCDTDWVSAGTALSAQPAGLTNLTDYYWQVQAVVNGETYEADFGGWWHFRTVIAPPAAFSKNLPANGGFITPAGSISWGASTRAAEYEYCIGLSNSSCTLWNTNALSLTKSLTGLVQDGRTYYWQVRAKNAGGTTFANGTPTAFYALTVDGVAPTVVSINRLDPSPSVLSSVRFSVVYSEIVTGVDKTDFQLVATGLSGTPTVTGVTGSGTTYTVTVSTGVGNGTLRLDARDDNTVKDRAGNLQNGTRTGDQSYTMLRTPSAFNKSTPASGSTVGASAVFAWGTASGATSYDFCYDTTNDNACSSWVTNGTATSRTLSGLVNGVTYYWQVRARNAHGVTYANGASTAFWNARGDTVMPRVTSITLLDPNPTTAASVRFSVTFSEAVSGVDVNDFSLTTAGITGAVISSATGSGAGYTVTVGTGSGVGTIRLNLMDNDSIKDNAKNPLGGPGTGNGSFLTGSKYTLNRNGSVISTGAQDGWVLETSEASNVGGTFNTTSTLLVGDDALNKQYRSVLSFNTTDLPDNAVIVRVTLTIRRASITGTDPFTTHGPLLADIRKGIFGTSASLEAVDFQAAPTFMKVGSLTPVAATPGMYQLVLPTAYKNYVNLLGPTQFRLRFTTDDNNDRGADYASFYGGEYATVALRPVLKVDYLIP